MPLNLFLPEKVSRKCVATVDMNPERHRPGLLNCQQGVSELNSLRERKSRWSWSRQARWKWVSNSNPWFCRRSSHLPAICVCNVTGDTSQLKSPLLEPPVCTSAVKLGSATVASHPQQSAVYLSQHVARRLRSEQIVFRSVVSRVV